MKKSKFAEEQIAYALCLFRHHLNHFIKQGLFIEARSRA